MRLKVQTHCVEGRSLKKKSPSFESNTGEVALMITIPHVFFALFPPPPLPLHLPPPLLGTYQSQEASIGHGQEAPFCARSEKTRRSLLRGFLLPSPTSGPFSIPPSSLCSAFETVFFRQSFIFMLSARPDGKNRSDLELYFPPVLSPKMSFTSWNFRCHLQQEREGKA